MDRGTIIIGVVILLACFLPLVLVYLFRKRDEKKLLNILFTFAQSNSCNINNYDLWSNTAIGIDSNNHMLFFLRKAISDEIQVINLKNIQKCRVVNTRTAYSEKGEKDAVGKLELALTHSDNKKHESLMEFYNTKHDNLTLNGELQLVEKWEKIVEDDIKSAKGK